MLNKPFHTYLLRLHVLNADYLLYGYLFSVSSVQLTVKIRTFKNKIRINLIDGFVFIQYNIQAMCVNELLSNFLVLYKYNKLWTNAYRRIIFKINIRHYCYSRIRGPISSVLYSFIFDPVTPCYCLVGTMRIVKNIIRARVRCLQSRIRHLYSSPRVGPCL